MPNITQLPILTTATTTTYFIVVDKNITNRFSYTSLARQINLSIPSGYSESVGSQGNQGAQGYQGQSFQTNVPTSSSSVGSIGQIAYDANYVYICVATNTWKRIPASTF